MYPVFHEWYIYSCIDMFVFYFIVYQLINRRRFAQMEVLEGQNILGELNKLLHQMKYKYVLYL